MDQKTFQTTVVGLLGLGVVVLVAMFAMDYTDRPTEAQLRGERIDEQVERVNRLLNR